MTTFRSKNENWFLSTFLRSFVQFEEADEDKKFINPKRCIWEKFRLQKVGVVAVFYTKKVVSDFHFGRFSTLRIEWLGQTSEFYRKGGMVRILVFIFFQPLLGLVSSPHSLFIVHSMYSQFHFHPAVASFSSLNT